LIVLIVLIDWFVSNSLKTFLFSGYWRTERSRGVYDSALYKCTFTYLLTYLLTWGQCCQCAVYRLYTGRSGTGEAGQRLVSQSAIDVSAALSSLSVLLFHHRLMSVGRSVHWELALTRDAWYCMPRYESLQLWSWSVYLTWTFREMTTSV